ncbi:MAG: M48 family metallopeptidase [Tatlockia sp.]|nr:M48 family metallopeptidase [Tatlockia sp.]
MTKTQLELDGIFIEIVRKPVKNLTLRIYSPDGRVTVSAPLKLRMELIETQIIAKLEWIHKQRTRLKTDAVPLSNFESGEMYSFMGKSYPLLIHQAKRRVKVCLEDETLHCFLQPNLTLREKEAVLEGWYREKMKEQLPALIAKWEPIIGVSVSNWGIRVMKTRWGSCNPLKKRIWLNLNLIKKPLACLEYVLVHELVHILEASHNKRFYALMDKFLPQWRVIKTLL